MRAFIVFCFLATAYAASVGYDYERQGSASTASIVNGGFIDNGAFGGVAGNGDIGGGFGSNGGVVSSGFGANGLVGAYSAPSELTKEFYTFTAPEDSFKDTFTGPEQYSNTLKRGIRVIFIKGPENSGLDNAALQLAKSVNEQRTAIYVLTKQADISNLANKLNSLDQTIHSHPEVHFVKYRTQADAENAQRVIQSQYDALGGRTNIFNGGIAPVLEFASSASQTQVPEPTNAYLPVSKRE
ncbi:uncharacterized protein [Musca autumnalis]|uniref:uncharacterized protein n=1 Tax=Musca autumnalis TaxID=221902 RepID=UPI003CE9D891